MSETVRIWFQELYKKEIAEVRATIRNEKVWELGYSGDEPNPHADNIRVLEEYLEELSCRLGEVT